MNMIIYLISSAAVLLSVLYFFLIRWLLHHWDALNPPNEAVEGLPTIKVSIIVPARNEADNIQSCLDSLTQQSYPTDLVEIIVIDDHSTDATAAIARAYHTKVYVY